MSKDKTVYDYIVDRGRKLGLPTGIQEGRTGTPEEVMELTIKLLLKTRFGSIPQELEDELLDMWDVHLFALHRQALAVSEPEELIGKKLRPDPGDDLLFQRLAEEVPGPNPEREEEIVAVTPGGIEDLFDMLASNKRYTPSVAAMEAVLIGAIPIRKGWLLGLREGFMRGSLEAAVLTLQQAVFHVLEHRFGTVPKAVRRHVEGIEGLGRLSRIYRTALKVDRPEELMDPAIQWPAAGEQHDGDGEPGVDGSETAGPAGTGFDLARAGFGTEPVERWWLEQGWKEVTGKEEGLPPEAQVVMEYMAREGRELGSWEAKQK